MKQVKNTLLSVGCINKKQQQVSKQGGFTLLEVLIAMTIFALISLAGVTILDTVIKSDGNSQQRVARLNEIQRAFLIMQRDFIQLARRSVRVDGEKPLLGFIHADIQSFSSFSDSLAFVRGGWKNPGLIMPRSDMQSVVYQLNDKTLERWHFNFVDAVAGQEPKKRLLLTQVKKLSFEFYNGKKWQKKLAKQSIPQAIAVEVELEDYGLIRREFLVAGDAPQSKNKGRKKF
ncbi:MAG: type II secretion system minor pseudopilin GspJ [Alteromonadaceae bacterium]|nr:type II secretion system minor pseudopilin GspJ [Alteromonadaceae bacterium]